MRNFSIESMRKDAKLTFILLEIFCASALMVYLIENVFEIDLGVDNRDALLAVLIGVIGGLIYFLFSIASELKCRIRR